MEASRTSQSTILYLFAYYIIMGSDNPSRSIVSIGPGKPIDDNNDRKNIYLGVLEHRLHAPLP